MYSQLDPLLTVQMVSDLPVISNTDCQAYYGIINDGIMCIDSAGGKGVCNVRSRSRSWSRSRSRSRSRSTLDVY